MITILYVVQGYFSSQYKWEDVTQSHDRQLALSDLRAYRENDPAHRYRLTTRRGKERGP